MGVDIILNAVAEFRFLCKYYRIFSVEYNKSSRSPIRISGIFKKCKIIEIFLNLD